MGQGIAAKSHLSYSEILRVVGSYGDMHNLSEVRILENEEGLILQGLVSEGEHAGERETYQLTLEDIEGLVHEAYSLRGKKLQG